MENVRKQWDHRDFKRLLLQNHYKVERRAIELAKLRGDRWGISSRSDARCRHKWECSLTINEAAAALALKEMLYPGMSRYAFVRRLLLAWIDAAAEELGVKKEVFYVEEE